MTKCWLVIFSSYKFLGFLNTKKVYLWIVVMLINKLYPDYFQNIKKILIVWNTINIALTFLVLYLVF